MGNNANSPPGPTRARSVKKVLDEFVEDHILEEDLRGKKYRLAPSTLSLLETAKAEKLPEQATPYKRMLFFRNFTRDLVDHQHYDLTEIQPEKIDKLSARKKTQLLKEAASQLQNLQRPQTQGVYTSQDGGVDDGSSVDEDFGMDLDMNDETMVGSEYASPSKNYTPVAKPHSTLQRQFTGQFTPPASVRGVSFPPELPLQPYLTMITPARPSYNGHPLTPPDTVPRLGSASTTEDEDNRLSIIREEQEVITQLREENEQLTEQHNVLKSQHELTKKILQEQILNLERDLDGAKADLRSQAVLAGEKAALNERVTKLDQDISYFKELLSQKNEQILGLQTELNLMTGERDRLATKCKDLDHRRRLSQKMAEELHKLNTDPTDIN